MDKYSLKARIYPMVIFLLPLIILGASYSIEYESYIQILTTVGVTTAFVYLLSHLGRDNGKRKEKNLWKKWGGMPTIQLFNFQNKLIDNLTKQKYHKKLKVLTSIDPSISFESSNIEEVEEVYLSWTKFLISKTRDTKKYSLLFKENISYGFRRNLWGLKIHSLILLFISMIGNYIFQVIQLGFYKLIEYPIQFYISEALLVILLLIWILVINSNWIKIPAFGYAERLLESIETID